MSILRVVNILCHPVRGKIIGFVGTTRREVCYSSETGFMENVVLMLTNQ